MKRYATLAAILALAAAPMKLRAADPPGPRISSPVVGYAFDDSTHAIRTISGVPGAASWGPMIDVPDTLTAAWVQGHVAVGIGKGGGIIAVSWKTNVRSTSLPTSLVSLHHVAFSRSSANAALTDGNSIEVWTNLDSEPTLLWHSAASAISIAVDNNGSVAAGLSDGTLARITSGESRVIASGGDWRAVAFNGAGVVAVDAAHTQLLAVDENGGMTTLGLLSGTGSALAISNDGEQVAVVEEGQVEVFRAGDAMRAAIDNAHGASLLDGNLTIYLRGIGRILDTDTGEPRVTLLQSVAVTAQGGSAQ